MDEQVRFSPEEIQALIKSGTPVDNATFNAMHPDDKQAYVWQAIKHSPEKVWDDIQKHPVIATAIPAVASMGAGAALGGGASLLSGLGTAIKGGAGGYLGYEGMQSLGKALGVNSTVTDILSFIAAHKGGKMMMGGGGGAGAAAAEESRLAPHLDRSVPVRPSELSPTELKDRIFNGSGTPSSPFEKPPLGLKMPQPEPPLTGADMPPNVDLHRTNADLAEQVQRGVQNDFKGRVNIQKPFPSNIDLHRTNADLAEQTKRGLGGVVDRDTTIPRIEEAKVAGEMNSAMKKGMGKPAFDKREIPNPPGTSTKTPPDQYEQASKDYAEQGNNPDAFKAAQEKVSSKLDQAEQTSKLKKKKVK